MEDDSDSQKTLESVATSPTPVASDVGSRLEHGSRSIRDPASASEMSWADDPDLGMATDDPDLDMAEDDADFDIAEDNAVSLSSAKSKRTPSQKGSARLARRGMADIEREAEEMRNILITQYGLDMSDEVVCDVSESESESDEEREVDYDTDLDMDMDKWLNADQLRLKDDLTGERRYTAACDAMGVTPATYFVKHITDQEVHMRFHGLGPRGAKAMCVPLRTNSKIEKLDLEGNWIDEAGCGSMAEMLRDNIYITELILSENKIGSTGALSMCEILMKNDTITKLDLSGNDIKDSAAENICQMLKKNTSLRHLFLSHNHFEEEGALHFKEALSYNESLETLDLSWNRFRTRGAIYIAEGVQENYGLRILNFSMNGLGLAGAEAMGKALKANRTLLDLDISFNRIPEEGAGHVAVGLQVNDVLQSLKISSNPLGSDGSLALLVAVDRNDCSCLKYLELLNVWVMDSFIDLKDKLERERNLIVVYGGLKKKLLKLTTLRGVEWERWLANNPMTKIKNYIRDTGYRLIDLFRDFDKDGNMSITKQEFHIGIQSAGIVMTKEQVDELVKRLDKDGNGEVDYGELMEGDREYRQALRAAAAKKKVMVESGGVTEDGDESESSGVPSVIRMLMSERSSTSSSESVAS
ncbi:leucine-rich repeat-containing protein 74A-like [Haliotis asinina]|uniref:leucine-rich repeat-containing protein 74A-like n=1 Tax=Haliotis asinina TaxID=109174 RepID=UPI0035324776